MANNNLKTGMETAQKYGITDIQFIKGKNEKQAIRVIYKGVETSTSSFVREDWELFFNKLACTEEAPAHESVASQKVSTAHGKDGEQTLSNQEEQDMTYADNWGSLIQVKGQELKKCLAQMVDITEHENSIYDENMSYYKTWVQHVISFYNYDMEKAKNIIMDLIKTNKVYIIREHIYTNKGLYEFIKNWYGENDIKISKEDIQNKVNEWVKLVA